MDQIMFIETGMGIDVHGQNVTKAAIRAVQNAIQSPNGSLIQTATAVPSISESK